MTIATYTRVPADLPGLSLACQVRRCEEEAARIGAEVLDPTYRAEALTRIATEDRR